MGLFSRNESAPASGRRSSLSSEAQVNELRGRARRRLIGALVLVLAAVILVPMLFDSSEPVEHATGPLVVPAIVAAGDSAVALAPSAESGAAGTISQAPQIPEPTQATAATPEESSNTAVATAAPLNAPAAETPATAPAKPEPKPVKKEEPKPKDPKPVAERTDDGSVAIALLEGRSPTRPAPAPAASGSGNFILQIAAYTNDKDAQVRRDRLISAGVTNAYVESATSGGKPTYRLRVGPFPTRDAAQAAQARLRALGYDNGFISTK